MDLVYYHAHKHIHHAPLLQEQTKNNNNNHKKRMARKAIVAPTSSCASCGSSANFILDRRKHNNIFFFRCCFVGSSILLIRYEFGLLQPKGSYSSHILKERGVYTADAPTNLFKIPTIFCAMNRLRMVIMDKEEER